MTAVSVRTRIAAAAPTGYAATGPSPDTLLPMRCHVYRSRLRPDTYVYLAGKDDFDVLPEPLRQRLGVLEPVMELELTPDRRLARADAAAVIQALRTRGCYLQLPPVEGVIA